MDMNTILAAFNKITSESMGMAGGSHTAMDSGKRCSSCGNRIEGSGKTTERGDVICADCDQHYAFGGPGEHEVKEAAGKQGAKGFKFPGKGRYGYKYGTGPGVGYAGGTAAGTPLLIYDKQTGETIDIPDFTYFDEDPDQYDLAELANDAASLKEAAMCEQCGQSPCQCESVNEGQCSNCGADPCVCESMSEGFRRELGDIQRLAECGEMYMPMQVQAQATSGMNVTTNVDSKTGTKTVTVSADGAGAEELMRVLANAGIAVAPMMSDMHQGMAEEVANHPAPQTLDTQTVMNQGEDLNRSKWQGNVDRARDNSMTFNEDVANLANSLRRQFMESENSNKFDTWTIKTGGITYTLEELKKMGADASFIQDDADDPDEYAETTYVMDKNTQKPLIVPNGKPIKWTSFKDPKENKFADKFDTWTVKSGGITYTLKQLRNMGADVSFIYDDAYDPAEYADEKFVMNKNTQKPLIVPNGKPIKWTSFENPNPEEDYDYPEEDND